MVFPTGRDPIGPSMIHGLLHTGRNLMGPPYWNGTCAQDGLTLVTWPMALWAHIRWTHVHWPKATIICSMYTEWNMLKALITTPIYGWEGKPKQKSLISWVLIYLLAVHGLFGYACSKVAPLPGDFPQFTTLTLSPPPLHKQRHWWLTMPPTPLQPLQNCHIICVLHVWQPMPML